MQKELIDGHTSFTLPMAIAKMMENEGVSDTYKLVTKYYSVRHPQRSGTKYIYLAYDSESMVAFNYGATELEYFDRVWRPDLIVVFGEASKVYYENHGFKCHLLNLGYDDLNYKFYKPKKRKYDVTFVGTIDPVRWSDFYHRTFIGRSLAQTPGLNGFFTNDIKYKNIGKIYEESLVGYNDVIRLSPNMRMFEIPSHGAFMLVNELIREFIEKYNYPLKEGKHYAVFETFPELVGHLKYAMKNREETMARGEKARQLIFSRPLSAEVKKMVKEHKLCED